MEASELVRRLLINFDDFRKTVYEYFPEKKPCAGCGSFKKWYKELKEDEV
ncbi:unnamed protein product, partial [marine sediment metagenome]